MGLPVREWPSEFEVGLAEIEAGSLGDTEGFMVAYVQQKMGALMTS